MNDERRRIDPQSLHQASDLTQVEEHALKLLDLLPGASLEHTRDSVQLNFQGEEGIVVILTPEALELRLPTAEWAAGAYVRRPFTREPDFAATSVNYDLHELWEQGQEPA